MKHINLKESKKWKVLILMIILSFVFLSLYAVAQGIVSIIKPLLPFVVACLLLGSLLLTLYFLSVKIIEGKLPNSLKLSLLPRHLVTGLAVGFGFFITIAFILYITGCYSAGTISFEPYIIKALAFYFLVACSEELVFRGILFRMLDTRWNYLIAMIISGLIFGLAHLPNPNATIWSAIAIAIEAGLLLGAAYKVSGTLWFPIGIHWAWNFTEGPLLGFNVSGTSDFGSLLNPTIRGAKIFTGGDFGPETSIITVILGLMLVALFTHKAFSKETISL